MSTPQTTQISVLSLVAATQDNKTTNMLINTSASHTLLPTVANSNLLYKSISTENYPSASFYSANDAHINTSLSSVVCLPKKQNNTDDLQLPLGKDALTIYVPKGWNRIKEKGLINYISPNKSRVTSMEDMILYLTVDGTCKCGLKCPLKPRQVFDFDPNVGSQFDEEPTYKDEKAHSCSVCEKFEKLFPQTAQLRNQGRGRKPGKMKRSSSVSAEEKIEVPERKKIFLTSASPLTMFQTKMNAINHSGSDVSGSSSNPTPQTTAKLNNSRKKAGKHVEMAEKGNSDSSVVDMPFPASLMGKRQTKRPAKRKMKKVLLNAVVQKASELLPITQSQVVIGSDTIPSLRNITSIGAQQISDPNTKKNSNSTLKNILNGPIKSLPPNRTVSGSNYLPKDLMNQLNANNNPTILSSKLTFHNTLSVDDASNNHLVNKPVPNSKRSPLGSPTGASQQMFLVKLVSQPDSQTTIGQPQTGQAVNKLAGQQQYFVVNKSSPEYIPKLATTCSPSGAGTLQIQSLVSTAQPNARGVSLHYLAPMQKNFSTVYIPSQNTTAASTFIVPPAGSTHRFSGSNYVRIAPATNTNPSTAVNDRMVQEKMANESMLLHNMKQDLRETTISAVPKSVISAASSFLTSVESSNSTTTSETYTTPQQMTQAMNQILLTRKSPTGPVSEISLKCTEKNACASDVVKTSLSAGDKRRRKFKLHPVGEVVWTLVNDKQWPGRVITADNINKEEASDEKLFYVMMYASREVHLVHHNKLTPLRKNIHNILAELRPDFYQRRNSKNYISDYERAIGEALQDLEKVE